MVSTGLQPQTMASAGRVASLLALLCLALSLEGTSGKTLKYGEIAFKTFQLASNLDKVTVEAADGFSALRATVSSGQGFLNCEVVTSREAVDSIVNDPDTSVRQIGMKEIHRMWQRCREAKILAKAEGAKRKGARALGPETRSLAIMSGTKWCGMGNNAENYDDLGESKETDKCCRTHDHCAHFIPGWTTKYHTFNTMPWTCSHCDCDLEFYNCLKKVNTDASEKVGGTFFGTLKMKCFKFSEEKICVEYHYSNLWCNRYGTDTAAVIEAFPFKWKGGGTH